MRGVSVGVCGTSVGVACQWGLAYQWGGDIHGLDGTSVGGGANQRSRHSWNTVCSNTRSRHFQRQRSNKARKTGQIWSKHCMYQLKIFSFFFFFFGLECKHLETSIQWHLQASCRHAVQGKGGPRWQRTAQQQHYSTSQLHLDGAERSKRWTVRCNNDPKPLRCKKWSGWGWTDLLRHMDAFGCRGGQWKSTKTPCTNYVSPHPPILVFSEETGVDQPSLRPKIQADSPAQMLSVAVRLGPGPAGPQTFFLHKCFRVPNQKTYFFVSQPLKSLQIRNVLQQASSSW